MSAQQSQINLPFIKFPFSDKESFQFGEELEIWLTSINKVLKEKNIACVKMSQKAA